MKFPLNVSQNTGLNKELVQNEPLFNEINSPSVEGTITNQWHNSLNDANIIYDGTSSLSFNNGRVGFNGRTIANCNPLGVESTVVQFDCISYSSNGYLVSPHNDDSKVWLLNEEDGNVIWTQDVAAQYVSSIPNSESVFAVLNDGSGAVINVNSILKIADASFTAWLASVEWATISVIWTSTRWALSTGVKGSVWFLETTGAVSRPNYDYIGWNNGIPIATKMLPTGNGNPNDLAIKINDGQPNYNFQQAASNCPINAVVVGPGFAAIQYNAYGSKDGWLCYPNDDSLFSTIVRGSGLDNMPVNTTALGSFIGATDVDLRSFSSRHCVGGNIHVMTNVGSQMGISWCVTGNLGTMLTSFASIDPDVPVSTNVINGKTYIAFKMEDRRFAVIILSEDIPLNKRLIKIASNLWKVNTVSVNNLIVIKEGTATIQPGSVDYNGRLLFKRTIMTGVSKDVNANWLGCGFNLNYENSNLRSLGFIAAQTQMNANCLFRPAGTEDLNGICLYSLEPAGAVCLEQGITVPLDLYYSNNETTVNNRYGDGTGIAQYAATFIDNAMSLNARLIGLSLPANVPGVVQMPLPIGLGVSAVIYGAYTVDVEGSFMRLWQANNLFYDGTASTSIVPPDLGRLKIFAFQGTTFAYDGTSIYRALPTDSVNILGELQFITNLDRMMLLGTASTEAFFYSKFDKTIYSFSGDRTVNAAVNMQLEQEVLTGIWSSHEQRLYFANREKVFCLDAGVLHSYPHPYDHDVNLTATDTGTVIRGSNLTGFLRTKYPILDNAEREHIVIESALLGTDSQEVVGYDNVQFYINVPNRSTVTIKLQAKAAFEDKTFGKRERVVTVRSNDLDAAGNTTVQIVPKFSQSIGFSWRFETADEVKLLAVNVTPVQIGRAKTVKFSGGK